MRVDKIILGPPGTGKTTECLQEVMRSLESGVPPEKIGYLTFARKAAKVAVTRAVERFDGYSRDDFRWFRTIHSLCFGQIGAHSDALMKRADYEEVCSAAGLEYAGGRFDDESGVAMGSEGDKALFACNLARIRGSDLDSVWEELGPRSPLHNLTADVIDDVNTLLTHHKGRMGLIDFTDILSEFLARGTAPHLSKLIIDEAQDLSWLQWECVKKLATKADQIVVAGDDDQAIFRWAGADVNLFQGLEGPREVLRHSRRLPRAPFDAAIKISSRISKRFPKEFEPRNEIGSVSFVDDDSELDAGPETGTWLFLARHGYLLRRLEKMCKERGWFYEIHGEASNRTDAAKAVLSWENFRKGRALTGAEVENMSSFLPDAIVGKTHEESLGRLRNRLTSPWFDVLDLPPEDSAYFMQARRAGEKMAEKDAEDVLRPAEPRIKISTVHASKGGEEDGVYLMTDVSRSTADAIEDPQCADDEHRVFYVGMTRCRRDLVVRRPESLYSYEVEE